MSRTVSFLPLTTIHTATLSFILLLFASIHATLVINTSHPVTFLPLNTIHTATLYCHYSCHSSHQSRHAQSPSCHSLPFILLLFATIHATPVINHVTPSHLPATQYHLYCHSVLPLFMPVQSSVTSRPVTFLPLPTTRIVTLYHLSYHPATLHATPLSPACHSQSVFLPPPEDRHSRHTQPPASHFLTTYRSL
jgi:hypothetical protein